jgi:hypothetical protein
MGVSKKNSNGYPKQPSVFNPPPLPIPSKRTKNIVGPNADVAQSKLFLIHFKRIVGEGDKN